MYLDNIEIKNIAPCVAETGKIRAEARFSRDVSEIFPYLNSVIRGAAYIQQKPLLTFSKASRVFTLYPQRVTVIKAVNTTDAIQVLDWLKDLINETYEKRKEIAPCHESKVSFTLHVYSRLPG